MKKLLARLKKLLGSSKGFTLIELLVTIAILGVLAAGVLVAIDPVDKIAAANDSKVQSDIGSMASASENYATANSSSYANSIATLTTAGELKLTPTAPSGYSAYALVGAPAACTNDGTGAGYCTSVVITGQLKSKKYTSATKPVQRYESSTGKTCQVATATTACP